MFSEQILFLLLFGWLLAPSYCFVPTNVWRAERSPSLFSSEENSNAVEGIRLNKVFKETHSRRQADRLIESGRVGVNGVTVTKGLMVVPFKDKITLDGAMVKGWEAINAIESPGVNETGQAGETTKKVGSQNVSFEYIKYWKPKGVTCTTDPTVPGNIIDALEQAGFDSPHRVFPVGRLDKTSTGLILLTSDGRLPNAALRGRYKLPKVYHVEVDQEVEMEDIRKLRDGVVISTTAQRDRGRSTLTAKTLPCRVDILGYPHRRVQMTLVEGRNRQIRKMMGALGYTVTRLHRVQFLDMTLQPLQKPGEFCRVSDEERRQLLEVIERAQRDSDEESQSE